jgi:hypothetical protein
MTELQKATVHRMLITEMKVMHKVYYDEKNDSINFRALFDEHGNYGYGEMNRLAIMRDGSIVNRNTDRRFCGIAA